MKRPLPSSALITVILTAILACAAHFCHAQMPDPTNLVQVTEMPASGLFFSMQMNPSPPWPVDPFPNLPLYTSEETPGQYWYDDLGIDYGSSRGRPQTSGVIVLSPDDTPPAPGGGSTNGGGGFGPLLNPFIPPASGYTNCETWSNF